VDSSPGHDSTTKALKLKELRKGTGRAKIVLLSFSHLVLYLILFCLQERREYFGRGSPVIAGTIEHTNCSERVGHFRVEIE
jgi:hypothetical protein